MGAIIQNREKVPREATLIFHHIPKTAGTTLDGVIDENYPADRIFTVESPIVDSLDAFRAQSDETKRQWRVIRGHGLHGLHAALTQPAIYAVLLREPILRVVSQYYFIRNSPGHPRHAAIIERGITLLDYLRHAVNPQADNGQVRALSGVGGGLGPEVPFGACTEAMLAAARRNVAEQYALVGLTARFDEFLVLAQRALGWRRIGYSRRKVTQHRPSLESLSPAERKALQDCNALDLELYETAVRLVEATRRRQSFFFPLAVARFQWRNARGRAA